jgi:DNA polymerase kappa
MLLSLPQVPGIGKVSEQTLNALGITICGHLLQQRALIAALFSSISARFFLSAGLGLGQTQHGSDKGDEAGACGGGGVGRKGISCERTFQNMSSPAEMEKTVRGGVLCTLQVEVFVFVTCACLKRHGQR